MMVKVELQDEFRNTAALITSSGSGGGGGGGGRDSQG